MMKHYLKHSFIACLSMISVSGYSQAPGTHSIELNGGLREYLGDMGTSLFFSKAPNYQGGGAAFAYYVSPSIDAVVNLSAGEVGFSQDISNFVAERDILWRSFRAQTGDLTFGARYKLNNGSILAEDAKFAPYVYGGIGAFYTHSTIKWGPHPYTAANRPDQWGNDHLVQNTVTNLGFAAQGGLGFKFFINDALALHWQYTMTYTYNDRWDGANYPDPNPSIDKPLDNRLYRTNDAWGYHALGFSYAIGEGGMSGGGSKRMKDEDEDGVPNKYDKCKKTLPKYRKFVDSEGCPVDTDGDGVLDGDDECIDIKGYPNLNGCPDADGDSIPDKNDACPKIAGLPEFKGCPDTDGDKVADNVDRCPTVAGLASLKGCPDKDGDNVADIDDKCPEKPGTAGSEGCPDTDGDGVFDNIDRCIDKPGKAESKGCPVIEEKVLEQVKKYTQGINFENNSAIIAAASNKSLDALVDILNNYPEAMVEVQGHTDNVGDASANKQLSQDRAAAVVKYLTGKGVNGARLKAVGYGQEMPIADNSTKAGKTKNRRVDFVLTY